MEQVKTTSSYEKVKVFYERHPEKRNQNFNCPLCGGKYKYFNKSHHNSSQKHQLVLKVIKDLTE